MASTVASKTRLTFNQESTSPSHGQTDGDPRSCVAFRRTRVATLAQSSLLGRRRRWRLGRARGVVGAAAHVEVGGLSEYHRDRVWS